jgi:predicted acyltransferase
VNQRFYSLDVFRGATVAFMILVNDPGSWSHIYAPLEHAAWHGLTPTDLIFPFFLFAVGNAMAFVMPRYEEAGSAVFWKKVIKRTLLIFFIGLFLTWYPFIEWQNDHYIFRSWIWQNAAGETVGVRLLGVLPRIALCYFFASVIIYYAKLKGSFLIGCLLLLIYWALCIVGNPSDPYSMQGWFGTAIDKKILGIPHMYRGEGIPFDPEGIMSTLPSITEVIFGFLVGDYIRKRGKTSEAAPTDIASGANPLYQTLTILFVAAVALLFTGYAWDFYFPINKKIWTSSYTVVTAGFAIIFLNMLIYTIEIKNNRSWWARFFDVFGKNALFIYALSIFIPKTLRLIRFPDGIDATSKVKFSNPWTWFYDHICAKVPGPPENGSLLFAICIVLLLWAIAYWMDKRKIYIKV